MELIEQGILSSTSKRIQVSMGLHRIVVRAQRDTVNINKRRMAQGIAPNVVHSWDAAHLMATVNKCKDYGIDNFAMVHDSYGTHAADIELMSVCLREAFIDQYTPDILEDFREEIIKQLPEDLAELIPEIPEKGSLDLQQVMDSEFFFA